MNMAAKQIRKTARRVANRLVSGSLVLVYHRVNTLTRDPQLLAVTPQHFDEQMRVLTQYHDTLPLLEASYALREGRPPRRHVIVTFDDGYQDNFTQALPILERHQVPATVFVAAGRIDSDREFWWDDLERLILGDHPLPTELRLTVKNEQRIWTLEDQTNPAAENENWHVLVTQPPMPRQRLYLDLCNLFRGSSTQQQHVWTTQLAGWANQPLIGRETHRAMTRTELKKLAGSPRIDIGGHTVNHPQLNLLDETSQQREILDGKTMLEQWAGRSVSTFSYPFGSRSAYDQTAVRAVRDAGFACGCANVPGLIRRDSDGYQLPRVLVRDWDGPQFARQLKEWFGE